MTPQDFINKWCLNRSELAQLTSVSVSTVNQWLAKNPKQEPHSAILKLLEIVDLQWEMRRQSEQLWRDMWQDFPPEVIDLYAVAIDRRELKERD